MSRSYVRIIKADDDKDAPKDTRKEMSAEEKQKRALMGKKLVRSAGGKLISAALKEDNPDVEDLFNELLHLNNRMFGDFLGLTEDEMFEIKRDEEGEILNPSLMSTPMITKEIISLIDFIASEDKLKFGGKEVDNTLREGINKEKELYLQEKDASKKNGEIAINIGTGFVPILAEGFERRRRNKSDRVAGIFQNRLLNYIQGDKTKHPLSFSMLATRDKIDMPVRERRPSKSEEATGKVDEDFASNLERQGAEARAKLGSRDVAAKDMIDDDDDDGERKVRVVNTPKKILEEKSSFPKFTQMYQSSTPGKNEITRRRQDMKIRSKAAKELYGDVFDEFQDYRRGGRSSVAELKSTSNTDMAQWQQLIENKMNDTMETNPKQAVKAVQQDFDSFMRMALQTHGIGSSGRPKKTGGEILAPKADSMVTPAFYEVAKRMGVKLSSPNIGDRLIQDYFKDGSGATAQSKEFRDKLREALDEDMITDAHHPALKNAFGTGEIFDPEKFEAEHRRGTLAGGVSPLTNLERTGGSATSSIGEMAGSKDTEGSVADLKRRTYDKTNNNNKVSAALKDLEFRLKYDKLDPFVYENIKNKILATEAGAALQDYNFPDEEMPKPEDFPEGHPYANMTSEEIMHQSKRLFDQLIGSGRIINDINDRLTENGLSQTEIEKLELTTEDVTNLADILNAGSPQESQRVLETFNNKNVKRYELAFANGVDRDYLGSISNQIDKTKKMVNEAGINPTDFATAAMLFSQNNFSKDSYNNAFNHLLARSKKGGSNAYVMYQVIAAAKKANNERANHIAYQESVINQNERFFNHGKHKPQGDEEVDDEHKHHIISEAEDCEACHPKHFSTTTSEEAKAQVPVDSKRIRKSAFVNRDLLVPKIAFQFNDQTGQEEAIPLYADDRLSVAQICHHIFGGNKSLKKYQEELAKTQRNFGLNGFEMKQYMQKQIRDAVKDGNPNIDSAIKKFNLKSKLEKIQPTGGANLTPHQRVALGHVLPNKFQGAGQRENARIRGLVGTQMSGLVEAFKLLKDIKSGEITDSDGKKISLKGITNKRNGKQHRTKLIQGLYKGAADDAKQETYLKAHNLLAKFIENIVDEHKEEAGAWHEEKGQHMVHSVDPDNPNQRIEGKYHASKIGQDAHDILTQERDGINDKYDSILQEEMDRLANCQSPMDLAPAGSNVINIPKHMFQMIGYADGDVITITGDDGTEYKAKIAKAFPPKYDNQDKAQLRLYQPLPAEISNGFVKNNELVKPRIFNQTRWFANRQKKGVSLDDLTKELNRKIKASREEIKATKKDADYTKRRNEITYGALMTAGAELLPLVGETDENKIFDALNDIREDIYTDSEGMPIPDVFTADGTGTIGRSYIYRPDKYMQGQLTGMGGTGLIAEHANILLPMLDDITMINALRKSNGMPPLTEEQKNVVRDSVALKNNQSPHVKRTKRKLLGDEHQEEESGEEDAPVIKQGKMSESELRRLDRNQHYPKELLEKIMSGGADELVENYIKGGPTACGTCGGTCRVNREEAIAYLQSHVKELKNANPNSPAMRRAIEEFLRPFNHQSFESHPRSDMLEPHEHSQYSCPSCEEHDHPDVGRYSSGQCSHCNASGRRDPHDDKHVQEGYENEDGEFVPGKISHHIEGGRLPPIEDMMSAQKPKFSFLDKDNPFAGIIPKNSMAIDAFKEGAARGMFSPLVTPEDANEMTKRYLTGLGKFDKKKFRTFLQQIKEGKDEFDPMSSVRSNQQRRLPTEEETYQRRLALARGGKGYEGLLAEPQPGIDNIQSEPKKRKENAILAAHHRKHIDQMLNTLIENIEENKDIIGESNYSKAAELSKQIREHEQLYSHHEEDEHELVDLFHQLQNIAHIPFTTGSKKVAAGITESGEQIYNTIKNKPAPFTYDAETGEVRPPHKRRSFQNLTYKDGMWQTAREIEQGVHRADKTHAPVLDENEMLKMYAHSPALLKIHKKYRNQGDYDEDDEKRLLDILNGDEQRKIKGIDKPLDTRKVKDFMHPDFKQLMEEFGIEKDEQFIPFGQEGNMTSFEGVAFNKDFLRKIEKEGLRLKDLKTYLGIENTEKTFYNQDEVKRLDEDYNNSLKSATKDQFKKYIKLLAVKDLLSKDEDTMSYENPGLLAKIKSKGLDIDNVNPSTILQSFFGDATFMDSVLESAMQDISQHGSDSNYESMGQFDEDVDMNSKIRLRNGQVLSAKNYKQVALAAATVNNKPTPLPQKPEEMIQYATQFSKANSLESKVAENMHQRAAFEFFPGYMYRNMANKAITDLGYTNMGDAIKDFEAGKLPQLAEILGGNFELAQQSSPLWQNQSSEDRLHYNKVQSALPRDSPDKRGESTGEPPNVVEDVPQQTVQQPQPAQQTKYPNLGVTYGRPINYDSDSQ